LPRKSNDTGEVLYRKPRANVYTAMLLIALLALVLGIVALYMEMAQYKFEFRRAPSVSALVGRASCLVQNDVAGRPSDRSLA
jgi:hypothetical protein